MRLIVAGSPQAAVPTLRRLAAEHEIAAVLTRPPSVQGRKRLLTPTPVAVAARELNLPVIEAQRVDEETTARLSALQADLGVIVAYGALLRPAALAAPRLGWINLHFSALPEWRGAAPVQRAVMAGASATAATVFQLVEELDAGPVYASERFDIASDATAGDVLAAMSVQGAGVVARVVGMIAAGTAAPHPQVGSPTFAPKLTIDDGAIAFDRPAGSVFAHVRGVTPEPGAWTRLGDVRVKLLEASRSESSDAPHADQPLPGQTRGQGADGAGALAPGALRLDRGRLLVGTATEPLELRRVQPAGKTAMDAAAWARGLGALDGLVLG